MKTKDVKQQTKQWNRIDRKKKKTEERTLTRNVIDLHNQS